MSHPEDIWVAKGPGYAAPFDEVHEALAQLLANDWRSVWDKHTRGFNYSDAAWYLNRETGLLSWSSYTADFQLRQTGKTAFTVEDYYQFHLEDEIKCFGVAALADEYFHPFRVYALASKNHIRGLDRVLSNPGRRPNLEFLWFSFLWDRFVIPFEFWTHEAIAGYYRAKTGYDGTKFNKERIRNWKRALKLKEADPLLVLGWDDAKNKPKFETRREVLARIDKLHGIPIPEISGTR